MVGTPSGARIRATRWLLPTLRARSRGEGISRRARIWPVIPSPLPAYGRVPGEVHTHPGGSGQAWGLTRIQNIENNPMQSSLPVAGMRDPCANILTRRANRLQYSIIAPLIA
jgi:hypothetical protein